MNSSSQKLPTLLPHPNGQVLSLISALSNTSNHALHVQAIHARDEALSSSLDSYQQLCYQLAITLVGTDQYHIMLTRLEPHDIELWQQTDPQSVLRLQQDPTLWIPFGQMAGLILKDALLRPPTIPYKNHHHHPQRSLSLALQEPVASHVQDCLLQALGCHHSELRAVASSIVSTLAVAPIGLSMAGGCVQPLLHLKHWKQLIPTLVLNVQTNLSPQLVDAANATTTITPAETNGAVVDGSITTIRKIMEDGPQYLDQEELDSIVPMLLQVLHLPISSSSHPTSAYQLAALQGLVACLSHQLLPSALILQFNTYLQGLSQLGHNPQASYDIQQWVCRNVVTLLSLKSELLQPHFKSICQFMLSKTAEGVSVTANNQPTDVTTEQQRRLVALEACEFWLTFANLEDDACSADMSDIMIQHILPSLIPILVQCMVYSNEQQQELLWQNQHDLEVSQQQQHNATMKPIFHRSKALRSSSSTTKSQSGANHQTENHTTEGNHEEDENDSTTENNDDDDDDDEEGNEWTLRKCAAASLDSLAGVFGAEPILPHLLPALEHGLQSPDPWVQEASILALGAVAEGCSTELTSSTSQLYSHLLQILALPENAQSTLPQLKCICAWTIGRYAHWVVEQVQAGPQGLLLLGQVTQVFMTRLGDCNRRVQVACCSAFGVVVEVAGDLMVPYLEPVYRTLVTAMSRYQGRSLLMIFDVFGILADCCGRAIADGELLFAYVPPLLQMWGTLAKNDPSDRTLLPLMEGLASIAVTSGMNYQPFALETYENAMAIIESVKLVIATLAPLTTTSGDQTAANDTHHVNDEDADPITCATDLLDGLVEGLASNFPSLVSSSQRYGTSVFLTMLHSLLCQHDFVTPGVHMSALALLGDLARHAPAFIQPALPQLLKEAIQAFDPSMSDASVCTNAVWAVGEICVKCRPDQGNRYPSTDSVLVPFVPTLMQNLIALLTGNGAGMGNRCVDIPGLAENAAACVGRLALVNPDFVAPELPRFILGWCEGLSKISDPDERRDAFSGFLAAVYANPSAIQNAVGAQDSQEVFVSILFAIMTWHIPESSGEAAYSESYHTEILHGPNYTFRTFPQEESELGDGLVRLVHDMKASVGEESWRLVEKGLPVNVRQLLRHAYNV